MPRHTPRRPRPGGRLCQAIAETRDYLASNDNPDATDDDALDHLRGQCGLMPGGYCTMAGSEYCDFDCAFA